MSKSNSASSPTRSLKKIRLWLYTELGDPSMSFIKPSHPLSDYVAGGSTAIAAFQAHLNRTDKKDGRNVKFKRDGLSLRANAVSANATVGDQIEAIVKNYHRRNWVVS